jgi:predicted CXXCH cytochrome family protein
MERANIVLPEEFPLDAEGRLTCATCHNPHVGDPGATRGVEVGMEICVACHRW